MNPNDASSLSDLQGTLVVDDVLFRLSLSVKEERMFLVIEYHNLRTQDMDLTIVGNYLSMGMGGTYEKRMRWKFTAKVGGINKEEAPINIDSTMQGKAIEIAIACRVSYPAGKGNKVFTGKGVHVGKTVNWFWSLLFAMLLLSGGGIGYRRWTKVALLVPDEYCRFHDDDVRCA